MIALVLSAFSRFAIGWFHVKECHHVKCMGHLRMYPFSTLIQAKIPSNNTYVCFASGFLLFHEPLVKGSTMAKLFLAAALLAATANAFAPNAVPPAAV
jgi:hypothetical protein